MKSEKIKCWILREDKNIELVEGKRIGKYILADNRFYFDSKYEFNGWEYEFNKLQKEIDYNLKIMRYILVVYGICVLVYLISIMFLYSK